MKAFCKTLALFLCILCICSTGFANVADAVPTSGAFAFGCFGYEIPLLYASDLTPQAPNAHTSYAASYSVRPVRLDAPVTSAEQALLAAQSILADQDLRIVQGEDGIYRAFVTDTTSAAYTQYHRVYILEDTLLLFTSTDPHALLQLDSHMVVLEEPVWGENASQVVSMEELVIPEYLPYGTNSANTGHNVETWQQALAAMLNANTYTIFWDEPQYADEQHDALSGYVQALNRSVTLVYSRENSQVQSVQWYALMSGDSSNADIYASTSTAGEAAAAVVTALFFADSGLDMAAMGANIDALQTEFTKVQSWLNALSTETLQLSGQHESSLEVLGRNLTIRVVADPDNGHRIECCLNAAE